MHLHIISRAEFVPQKALSRAWNKATSGSSVVDIRAIKNISQAASYVIKYASKGTYDEAIQDAGIDVAEIINNLYRRRTVIWFGKAPDAPEDDNASAREKEKIPWEYLGDLSQILWAARHGVESALRIVAQLNNGGRVLGMHPYFPP